MLIIGDGAAQRYNDIASWDWTRLPQALGATSQAQSWQVVDRAQLNHALNLAREADGLALIEVMLPEQNFPSFCAPLRARWKHATEDSAGFAF